MKLTKERLEALRELSSHVVGTEWSASASVEMPALIGAGLVDVCQELPYVRLTTDGENCLKEHE